ncbi:MAG TPA: putative baseplate assembly protein [Clostridia bacterium]|nr:putative baseplate assembly protein [Clostridia bacterium]
MTALEPVLGACGCCDDAAARTGNGIDNRPGLSALAYRCGTHATFRRAMLGRIARTPELRELTTRAPDDPSIALLDAWAAVLDVLTFYQERIANEGFLRTATERRSVYELAATIGYQPSPGVAASSWLAFELERGPGTPSSITIPTGTKVQSVPGQDELPQTFETGEALLARPSWNRVAVRRSERRVPGPDDTEAWLAGTATNLQPGDAILLVGRERRTSAGSENWDFRLLTDVEPDPDRGITRIAWDRGLGWRGPGRSVKPAARDVRCFAFRERASLFGAAAPDWRSMPPTIQGRYDAVARKGNGVSRRDDWPGLTIAAIAEDEAEPDRTIFLDAIYPRLVPDSWIVLQQPSYEELYRPDPRLGAAAIADDARTGFTLSAKSTRVVLQGENLIERFNAHVRDTTVFLATEELALAESPLVEPLGGRRIDVEDALDGFERGRTVIVLGPRPRLAVREGRNPVLSTATGPVALEPRDVLTVTAPPVTGGDRTTWTVETAAGLRGTVTARPRGDLAPASAPAGAEVIAEAAVVKAIESRGPGRATLELVDPLRSAFDRAATVVAANVVSATHGESRTEILGGADASVPFQSFELKQSPVTYVPSATANGASSTLTVEVNDVAWREERSLVEAGPRDRAFVTDVDDAGATTVRFGDGRRGARPPTGVENVRAAYRVGIGTAGNVRAGQLSLLVTRPLGTRGVTNPLPAAGGADSESRDDARANAPRTVLTLDRVVSLVDVADFARSFAGIGKSEARWVWEGRRRVILLTVAGSDGRPLPDTPTLRDLAAAIAAAGDPRQPVRIVRADQRTFDLEAGVFIAAGRDWERVSASVRAALLDAFSFERRALAQPLTTSEVSGTIQAVDGVEAVDLDGSGVRITGTGGGGDPILLARPGRAGHDGPRPAQLLTINPDGIVLVRRT